MNAVASSQSALSLDGSQMRRVLELLELHADQPAQAREALAQMVRAGRLTAAQRPAVAALLGLGAAEADRALNAACGDDEAVECLLQLRTHEARLEFVGAGRREPARPRAAAAGAARAG